MLLFEDFEASDLSLIRVYWAPDLWVVYRHTGQFIHYTLRSRVNLTKYGVLTIQVWLLSYRYNEELTTVCIWASIRHRYRTFNHLAIVDFVFKLPPVDALAAT